MQEVGGPRSSPDSSPDCALGLTPWVGLGHEAPGCHWWRTHQRQNLEGREHNREKNNYVGFHAKTKQTSRDHGTRMLKLCHQQPQQWMQLNLTLLSIKVLKFVEDATNNDLTWDSDYTASRGENAQDQRCQGTLKSSPPSPLSVYCGHPWVSDILISMGKLLHHTVCPKHLRHCLVVLCQTQKQYATTVNIKVKIIGASYSSIQHLHQPRGQISGLLFGSEHMEISSLHHCWKPWLNREALARIQPLWEVNKPPHLPNSGKGIQFPWTEKAGGSGWKPSLRNTAPFRQIPLGITAALQESLMIREGFGKCRSQIWKYSNYKHGWAYWDNCQHSSIAELSC